jgi:hypothetical protein
VRPPSWRHPTTQETPLIASLSPASPRALPTDLVMLAALLPYSQSLAWSRIQLSEARYPHACAALALTRLAAPGVPSTGTD